MIFSLQFVAVSGGWQSVEILHNKEFMFTDFHERKRGWRNFGVWPYW